MIKRMIIDNEMNNCIIQILKVTFLWRRGEISMYAVHSYNVCIPTYFTNKHKKSPIHLKQHHATDRNNINGSC